jgi:FAD/FMN-containing dehydrogenase
MPAFEPFLDARDLSACVPAGESAGALNARAQAEGCYFPLWLDLEQPLGELFLQAPATPRSFRYGRVADNVLGLTWELPGGALLGLGGRVVKNVAGFDWVRFAACSQGRLGRPKNLVLRLRPLAKAERALAVRAPAPALKALAREIRASSWAHAIDSLDLSATPQAASLFLSLRARRDLLAPFDEQVRAWARPHGAQVELLQALPEPGGRPWALAQAPLDDCVDLAVEWMRRYGGRVHAFLGQGSLQLDAPTDPALALAGLRELGQRLEAEGGHVSHPGLAPALDAPQARWEAELLGRLEALR